MGTEKDKEIKGKSKAKHVKKRVSNRIIKSTKKVGRATINKAKKLPKSKPLQLTKSTTKKVATKTKSGYKKAHKHVAQKPHEKLMTRFPRYAKWHSWQFKRLTHNHVHLSALLLYVLFVGLLIFSNIGYVFAADLSNTWNFSTPADFEFSDQLETNGSSVRLKTQEYANDGNTSAMYHLNETNGNEADDTSVNNNNLTLHGSPTFEAGNLNNGLTLNGTTQYGEVSDSATLSMTNQQSLEAWIKPSNVFDKNSSTSQMILDKGSYRMGLDRTSGKAFYEVEKNNSQSWTKRLGGGLAGSWSTNHTSAWSSVANGSDIYVGLGGVAGDGEVWKWNGSIWEMVGGDGIRNGWSDQAYEGVRSLMINENALYAGLGNNAGDGEIWTCDLSNNCNSWTKIGGDGIGTGGPGPSVYTAVTSMYVYSGSLYVGMAGLNARDGDLFKYNGGTSWTQVAGDGLNNAWAANTFTGVSSLFSDGTNLYAGLVGAPGSGDLWKFDGTTWSQIGGDGINLGGGASWSTSYESVTSIVGNSGKLYIGLGISAQDAEVWQLNGTSWTKIAGDGVGGTWNSTVFTNVYSLDSDGTNIYASIGSGSAAAEVWKWDGSSWSKIGGGQTNSLSGWTASLVGTSVWANNKLYSVPASSSFGSAVYEWNGSSWSMIGGQYLNNSWGTLGISSVQSSTVVNGKIYFGLSSRSGNPSAFVYEYDGETANRIGGSSKNNSWPAWLYEGVYSMVGYKGALYVGLGSSSGDGDVWKWDGTNWSQVGGNGINSSWNSTENTVSSMTVFNGKLYIGLGVNSPYSADVWEYNGSSWTQVGGDVVSSGLGVNGSWAVNPRGVDSMTVYNNQLCVGLGGNSYSEVWCWSGSGNWTKIGGVGLNGSWSFPAGAYISSMSVYDGSLYVGASTTSYSRSNVWKWDGSSWTNIGGTDLNSSWSDGSYIFIKSMAVYNGYLYASMATTGSGTPAADIWRWDGTSWVQVAGDGSNGSWTTSDLREEANTLSVYKGKLYVGLGFSGEPDALVYSFGDNAYVESNATSFNSSWYHFAGTYDGTNIKFFINGTQENSASSTGSGVDNNKKLLFGTGYGSSFEGPGQGYFAGQLDEIRLSNIARSGFMSKPYADSEQTVTLATATRTSGVASWDGLAADESPNGGSIKYRLSDNDGSSWKYWDGSNWAESNGLNQTNTISEVNSHLDTFAVTFNGIRWQAVLKGDGSQRVQLNNVTLTSNSDNDNPSDISNINMYKSNGGDSIASSGWTNSATPYFSWDSASDSGSGILGYCLYLGTTSSSDPASTKGLLGTGSINTGGNCQYAVSNTNIDLSNAGVLNTALITSNDSYYLNVKAIDKAGNLSSNSSHFVFKFDNTPPNNPGYITAPSQFVANKEVTFTWPTSGQDAPSDNNSGLAGLQYRIGQTSSWYGDGINGDGMLTNDGSYTTRNNPDFSNIIEGNNTVYFRTIDQAGNTTTSYSTAALKLNTTSPTGPQNIVATPVNNNINDFAFAWSPPATFSGNVNAITYCYTVNTAPTVNTCTFTNAGVTSLPSGAYATQPGDNTFYVVAKDEAGNINYATANSVTFTANTSAPGIPLDIDIADVSVKSTSSWKLAITWESPTNVGAGVASYKIYRSTDNNSYSQVASTSGTSFVDSGLSQQKYFYKVKACDSANNCGAFSIVKDSTPTGKFTSPANITAQPSVSNISTRKAVIKWATDRNSDSKISLGTNSERYDPFQVASQQQVTDHSIELSNLTPGTTYFAKAVWTDEDGNTGLSPEFSFKTEPAPSTQEVTTQRIELNSALIRFTSVSAAKVVVQFGKSDSFGGVKEISTSLSKSTYDIELSGLEDGSKYYYRLNTFDAEGNEYTGSTTLAFTTPARPHISNLRFQPVDGEPTSTQEVSWNTNVPASTLVRFTSPGIPTKEVSESKLVLEHKIVIKDLLDDTSYTLVAESRDEGGNLAISDSQTLKTALDTRPPKISDVTIETAIRGTGAEARGQVVVSWKTDELSTSQVAYGEGSQVTTFNNKTAEDAALALEHIVIVSDLPTSRVYSVQPISKDRSNNSGNGEIKSAIIGKASDSVLTIVLGTLKKVFGF